MTKKELDSVAQWLMRANLVNTERIERNPTTEQILRQFVKDKEEQAAEALQDATDLHTFFRHALKVAAEEPLYLSGLDPDLRSKLRLWQVEGAPSVDHCLRDYKKLSKLKSKLMD